MNDAFVVFPSVVLLFLTTTPYGSQSPVTALNLAEEALDQGYQVNLFLSADAVYGRAAGRARPGLTQRRPECID